MFYSIKGKLIEKGNASAAVETGGIAYLLSVSFNTRAALGEIGSELLLYTYLHVKEGGIELYGFETGAEKDAFLFLLSVSGVGPKAALSVLSDFTPDKLALAVISGDEKSLSKPAGVGKKTAARIILDLKDKLGNAEFSSSGILADMPIDTTPNNPKKEAVAALLSLGFTQSDATMAVSKQPDNLTAEEIIKNSLKSINSRI